MGCSTGSCGHTGATNMDGVTGSIYSGDPRVDTFHLISSSGKEYTLYLSQHLVLTHSFPDFVDPHNCIDPHVQIVSYLLARLLQYMSQNHSVLRISFQCCERCGGVPMMGSHPSSSILSPQRQPHHNLLSQQFTLHSHCHWGQSLAKSHFICHQQSWHI